MRTAIDVAEALCVETLLARFLQHTRRAFERLPEHASGRILDIGCGSGRVTAELARLTAAEVVGLDPDGEALSRGRARIASAGLEHRVSFTQASLLEANLAPASFNLLWAEGVLHLLPQSASFEACHRLLPTRAFLVLHETCAWFDGAREHAQLAGFEHTDTMLLPPGCWWTGYGAPLEERTAALRKKHGDTLDPGAMAFFEAQVRSIKEDPDQLACAFFFLQRSS